MVSAQDLVQSPASHFQMSEFGFFFFYVQMETQLIQNPSHKGRAYDS